MELSERCIKTLENEGFASVYEEVRSPGEVFLIKSTASPITIYVTEGSVVVINQPESTELLPGARLNLNHQLEYQFEAGSTGCQYVVGEM